MCDTNPIKLGFVVAEFNRDITYMMEIEGREHAAFLGAEVTECFYVPGAYDMPLAIKKMLTNGKVDAVVTIGCVIEGSTQHDEIVVQHAARKIIDLSLEFGKPVTLGHLRARYDPARGERADRLCQAGRGIRHQGLSSD